MLLTPGPVEVLPELMPTTEMIHHRGVKFAAFYKSLTEKLRVLSGAENAVILSGSGTLANEAMLSSLRMKKVLVASNGEFGRRLREISRIYSDTDLVEFAEGTGINYKRLSEKANLEMYDAIALVENETSTACLNDVKGISSHFSGKTFVDSVSAWPVSRIGCNSVSMFTTCSQKCLGIPSGLSFVFLDGPASEEILQNGNEANYYANLRKYLLRYSEKMQTPFTPAITLLMSLDKSLDKISEIGIEKFRQKHKQASEKIRKRILKLGYRLMGEEGFHSDTVVGLVCRDGSQRDMIKAALANEGFHVAGGKGVFSENGLRIGVMGFFDEAKIDAFLDKLEEISFNYTISVG